MDQKVRSNCMPHGTISCVDGKSSARNNVESQGVLTVAVKPRPAVDGVYELRGVKRSTMQRQGAKVQRCATQAGCCARRPMPLVSVRGWPRCSYSVCQLHRR